MAPGSGAPNPASGASSPYGAQPVQQPSRIDQFRQRLRQRRLAQGGVGARGAAADTRQPVSPPPGYRPSVNRDGTIPDQAPVAGGAPAAAGDPRPAPVGGAPAGATGPQPRTDDLNRGPYVEHTWYENNTPQMAGDQKRGAGGGTGAIAPPAASGPVDPNQALAQVQQAFTAKFNRHMTPEEQQALIQYAGYTGGAVSPETLQKALGAVQQYSGSLANPWGPAPGAGPTTGPPAPNPMQSSNWASAFQSLVSRPPVQLSAPNVSFVDPTDAGVSAQLNALMSKILGSPESLSPEVVAMMKEKGKEQTLQTHKQLMDQIGQSAASRGAYGGGNQAAQGRRAADATTSELLRGSRDIDIAAAETNMADRRAAAGLGDQYLTSGVNRALGVHGANLGAADFNLRRELAQAGLNTEQINQMLSGWGLALQGELGTEGLKLDKERIDLNRTQFNEAHKLDWMRVLNEMVMGRANYGLNLAELQQTGQNNMFNWLFGGR